MAVITPGSTIGIIGGGQLGRMSAMAAATLGYKVHIFCPDKNAPALQFCTASTIADYTDEKALLSFAKAVDVISFEFENIPYETVEFLSRHAEVRPSARALYICQHRIREKDFVRETPEQLALFRWSSLRRILRRDCPDYLAPSGWIDHVREVSSALDKVAAYGVLITKIAQDPDGEIAIGMRGMTRGPVIGSRGFRTALVEHASPPAGEETWHEALETLLDSNGKSREDVEADAKGAPWKVDLALTLRNRVGAPLEWIARELGMGTVNSVSHHLWLARKSIRELQSA